MERIMGFLNFGKRGRWSKSYYGILVECVRLPEQGMKEEALRNEVGRMFGRRVVSFTDHRGSYICDPWDGQVLFHSVRTFEELDLDEIKGMMHG